MESPSLFDLAHRTGYDFESLVFSFAIGGLAVASYQALAAAPERSLDDRAHCIARYRWHTVALLSPFIVFAALLPVPWNPIYAGIGAMLAGAVTTLLCRPDLLRGTLIGGLVFLALYTVFLLGLKSLCRAILRISANVTGDFGNVTDLGLGAGLRD